MNKPKVILSTIFLVLMMLVSGYVGYSLVDTGTYYLDTPLPLASYYVGKYTNGSYFSINGANWDNEITSTNATYVLDLVISNCTDGMKIFIQGGVTYGLTTIYTDTFVEVRTTGVTITEGQVVCFDTTTFTVTLAKADSATTMGLGYVYLNLWNTTAPNRTIVLENGYVAISNWAWTPNDVLYVSPLTGGALTATIPNVITHVVMQVGTAITATIIKFQNLMNPVTIQQGVVQSFTYTVNVIGSNYFAWFGENSTIAITSTNCSEVLETIIDEGVSIVFRQGTYPIDYRITLDVENFAMVGESVEGVVFDIGPNGEFYFYDATWNIENLRFENIYFDGTHATNPCFNGTGVPSNRRVGQARFVNCRWQDWTRGEATVTNYALVFRGYDYMVFQQCYFVDAPIALYANEHESGNSWIKDSVIMTTQGWEGFYMVYAEPLAGTQNALTFGFEKVQFLAHQSNDTIAVLLNNTRGEIKNWKFDTCRAEACSFLRAYNATQIEMHGCYNSLFVNDAVGVYLDSSTVRCDINNNYWTASSNTNQTAIWDDGTGTSNDRNHVRFNRFNGYGNANDEPIRVDAYTILFENTGFVTRNMGKQTVANNEWFAHGLDSSLNVAKSNATGGITVLTDVYDGVFVHVNIDGNINGTKIQVSVMWHNGTYITDDAIEVWWWLEYDP